jgi:UDPglucose 6-dehydrogenase
MSTSSRSRQKKSLSSRHPKRARIAFIGTGYVGLVSGACMAELGHRVICVGREKEKIQALTRGKLPLYEPGLEEIVARNLAQQRLSFTTEISEAVRQSEFIFLAVGTPSRPDGSADLSDLATAAQQIAGAVRRGKKTVVTKSTVPPGTGKRLAVMLSSTNPKVHWEVASNPEFLREGSAVRDFLQPDRVVIGAERKSTARRIAALYTALSAPCLLTDLTSAELIKYASNAFLATKISFANMIARLCDQTGAQIGEVMEGMGSDRRIGKHFLRAGIGFGGSCFPKDVRALIHTLQTNHLPASLLQAVLDINAQQQAYVVALLERALLGLAGKRIAVWGLAFKPRTDDVREAPALKIIEELSSRGAHVQAYDPAATLNARRELKKRGCKNFTITANPYEAATEASALLIATEWPEFSEIDLPRVQRLMAFPLMIDGRNIFPPAELLRQGWQYYSIGRPLPTPLRTPAAARR